MRRDIPDLWPDDIGPNVDTITPISVLRYQGSLLYEKTKGALRGDVETIPPAEGTEANFMHVFNLAVPTIGYRYALFYVSHSMQIYPIRVTRELGVGGIAEECPDIHSFEMVLTSILHSEQTKKIIQFLLSLSNS